MKWEEIHGKLWKIKRLLLQSVQYIYLSNNIDTIMPSLYLVAVIATTITTTAGIFLVMNFQKHWCGEPKEKGKKKDILKY